MFQMLLGGSLFMFSGCTGSIGGSSKGVSYSQKGILPH